MLAATVSKARDLATRGVRGRRLAALQASGELTQVARGLYVTTDAPPTAHHSLVQAAVAVPRGVVCLLSALRFHSLGTQSPHEVWLAIDVKAWRPRVARSRALLTVAARIKTSVDMINYRVSSTASS